MSRNSNDSEIVSIKQQIAEAKDELAQMQSVANVAVQDLSKMTQKQRYDWAVNELKRTGYKVDSPNFGVIEFTPKQINTGMNYLRSAEDVAAFAVLPKVLKQGNIIFENNNHKGRQFATFTISAPVTINGTTGYMAVVVQENSSRHYHTHRIVLPDGSAFKFEMQHSDPSGGFAQNSTRLATNTNAASKNSVAQPNAEVKGNFLKSSRDSEYLNLAQNPEENREALSRIVEQAAREAVLNYNLQDGQKNNAREGERFSIRKTQKMSWDEQIMGALYGKGSIARNDTLVAGQISTSLAQEGIEQLPLAIPRSVLTKASDGRDISHSIKKGKLAKLNVGIKNSPITIVNPARNAIVFITDIKQGGAPVLVAFDRNTLFDGDKVHKATSIHLQMNVQAMLENLPASATVYVKNRNELAAVGATDNLRGLAANVKLISDGIVAQPDADVKGILKSSRDTSEMTYAEILAEQAALRARQEQVKAKENAAMNNPELLSAMDSYTEMFSELRNLLW